MALQEGWGARPHAQALPDAVTEDEAPVADRHDRPLARHEFAVDPDEDALVAGVVLEVVRALSHRAKPYGQSRAQPAATRELPLIGSSVVGSGPAHQEHHQ